MYTSYIGKKFLQLYNKRNGENLSAEDFFDKEFFPLFFNSERHLMHVSNSPFFQKPKAIDIKQYGTKALAQYNNLKTAIENDIPNMSIYVGAASKDIDSTTSGQISNIDSLTTKEDIYASWIGEALSIGISGGIMLIDKDEVLWTLYSGWKSYRSYLNQTPHIKDNQIETWNGQWFWHTSQYYFDENYPLDNLELKFSEITDSKGVKGLGISVQEWIKIIFALAYKYPDQIITAYSYNLSKTNTTLGFIRLHLPEVYNMIDVIDRLFPNELKRTLSDNEIKSFTTFFNFKAACSLGTIGLRAIEPAQLRKYIPKGSIQYAQGKDYKFNNEESYIKYKLFKTWIIAMLNKMELLQTATKIAEVLIFIENKSRKNNTSRGKTDANQKSKELLDSKRIVDFIEGLRNFIEDAPDKEVLHNAIEETLVLPVDLFPLFMALIRFEYNYIKK